MAVLDKTARDRMPSSEFGQPKTHGYPMNDPTHARLAISGASRAEHAGNISEGEKNRLQSEARAKLAHWGKGDGDPKGGGDHKAAIAKMHPEHVHRLMTEAAAGQHGQPAMDMAHHAMQPTEAPQDSQQAPQRSPFSDNDQDDSSSGPAAPAGPPSRASMFGMDGGQ